MSFSAYIYFHTLYIIGLNAYLGSTALANLVRSLSKLKRFLDRVSLTYLTWINYKLSDILTMLQVRTATDCTRYSQGVAGAVTSPPLLPPPGNRRQHGLITRRRTRVSLQRLPLADSFSLFQGRAIV